MPARAFRAVVLGSSLFLMATASFAASLPLMGWTPGDNPDAHTRIWAKSVGITQVGGPLVWAGFDAFTSRAGRNDPRHGEIARLAAVRLLLGPRSAERRAGADAAAGAVHDFLLAQMDAGFANVVLNDSLERNDRDGGRDGGDAVVPAVPEPASVLGFGLGALIFGAFRMRRRAGPRSR